MLYLLLEDHFSRIITSINKILTTKMSYRTYNVTPGQSSSGYQFNSHRQAAPSQATSYNQPASHSRPAAYTQPSSHAQQNSQAYHNFSTRPSSTVWYVSSTRPTRSALLSQRELPTHSIYCCRNSYDEPLMIGRQRRIDEIADVLPVRTTRRYPETAQNIYTQNLAFVRTANCRHDGRFHCDCGYSTSRQYRSISHATGAHNALTPTFALPVVFVVLAVCTSISLTYRNIIPSLISMLLYNILKTVSSAAMAPTITKSAGKSSIFFFRRIDELESETKNTEKTNKNRTKTEKTADAFSCREQGMKGTLKGKMAFRW